MHRNLCCRQSGNICQGGYLQEKAAGTPLPGDLVQRKRGWCFQLFVHAEQTLRGWLLLASGTGTPSQSQSLMGQSVSSSGLYAQIPSTYESNLSDDPDVTLRNLEPVTPMSTGFLEVKTPQCLHLTPGMMGSPNRWAVCTLALWLLRPDVVNPWCSQPHRSNDDKYVFQLQKRMKKRQFNVCKKATSKKVSIITFSPEFFSPRFFFWKANICLSSRASHQHHQSSERWEGVAMQVNVLTKCYVMVLLCFTYTFLSWCFISVLLGQDTFVVWEMFPGNERALSDSEEEEDYYFSDNNCT